MTKFSWRQKLQHGAGGARAGRQSARGCWNAADAREAVGDAAAITLRRRTDTAFGQGAVGAVRPERAALFHGRCFIITAKPAASRAPPRPSVARRGADRGQPTQTVGRP